MLLNIVIGAVMIIVTICIHAEGMELALRARGRLDRHTRGQSNRIRMYCVGIVVLWLFLTALVEVAVWAAVYMALDVIERVEQALYFSMVTLTTLGYGDIVLDERWRLLASFEAATGIIVFGWTTAIVIATVQRVYFREESAGRIDNG